MTNYLTLTEFVPGTKAKAEEVNANFSTLKDAINTKALLNGDSANIFNVAEGTTDTNAVNKKQLNALAQQTIDATKFCCNKGLTTDGAPSLLSYYNNTVTLNATSVNPIITDHLGVSTTLTSDITLDASGITNIIYIYYKTDDGTMFKTINHHVFLYSRPQNPVEDTIYVYPNNNVWVAEYYKNSTFTTLTGCAYLGTFTPQNEQLTASNWTTTDWSGSFSAGFTHATGNVTALSNSLAALIGTKYQVSYTVTGCSAGSFKVSFGGNTSPNITASGCFNLTAVSTTNISITPTSDFNGTVLLSVKVLTINTNLYNQNGLNISSQTVFKENSPLTQSITDVIMPDYSNGIFVPYSTTVMASCNGLLNVVGTVSGTNQYIKVTVNNTAITDCLQSSMGGNICSNTLIGKGDTFIVTGWLAGIDIKFYPLKGAE